MAKKKQTHQKGNRRNHTAVILRKKEMIIDLLNKKKRPSEMADAYVKKYGISRTQIQNEFSDIINYFRYVIERNYHRIAREHFDRYEEMFHYCKQVNSDRMAMYTMDYKERLIGFHKEAFEISVDNTNEQIVTHTHNLDKLSDKERQRFLELEKKMKKSLDDI